MVGRHPPGSQPESHRNSIPRQHFRGQSGSRKSAMPVCFASLLREPASPSEKSHWGESTPRLNKNKNHKANSWQEAMNLEFDELRVLSPESMILIRFDFLRLQAPRYNTGRIPEYLEHSLLECRVWRRECRHTVPTRVAPRMPPHSFDSWSVGSSRSGAKQSLRHVASD